MTDLAVPWSGDPYTVLAASDPDSFRLVSGWLLEQAQPNTRTAYRKDVTLLAWFLSDHGVQLTAATRQHLALWAESMRRTVNEDGGRVISESTIARRLSSASSFFTYAVQAGVIGANPIQDMKRPKRQADEDGIAWLDREQMLAFLAAAEKHSRRSHALVALMLTTGARTGEVLAADVADLGHTGGHRVLTVTRKGGKRQNLPIVPWVGTVIDEYLAGRTDGALFATTPREGPRGRLDEPAMHRLVRRIGELAAIPQAKDLHPHSLRHSALTEALERGCSLRDVQALAGHVDPRTTERYDRMRSRLDHSPAYALGASLAAPDEDGDDA
jgi:site-specific recombinase XerD